MEPGDHDHLCEDSEALRFGVTSGMFLTPCWSTLSGLTGASPQAHFMNIRVAPLWLLWRCWA